MRVPTASQRESAEPGVDAFDLILRWRPRLTLPARLRNERQCDGAGSTVATLGRRWASSVKSRSRRRAEDGREARRRHLPALAAFGGVRVPA